VIILSLVAGLKVRVERKLSYIISKIEPKVKPIVHSYSMPLASFAKAKYCVSCARHLMPS
jgi:hypothetical protein